MSRRGALTKLGGLAAVALGGGALGARELLDADDADAAEPAPRPSPRGSSRASSRPSRPKARTTSTTRPCGATSPKASRASALTLRLTVVNASSCKPIKGAAVEIWHCDAGGVYSGVQGEAPDEASCAASSARTRRASRSSARIYPGWYQGRTVHIHTMVHLGGNVVHTGQLYFPDAVTDAVYARSPYNQRPEPRPRETPATASTATAGSARR